MAPDHQPAGERTTRGAAQGWVSSASSDVELVAWQLLRTAAGSVTQPMELRADDDAWISASAPGTVAAALADAGQWGWSDPINLDDYDWWYRCRFRCDEPSAGASLDFAGLATLADVWLNGTHLLSSSNMFVAHTVETGTALQDDNELLIRFAALTSALSAKRQRPAWRTRLVSHQNLRWFRTTLIGRMPGWSATPQPIGPWKAVMLRAHGTTRITSRQLHTRLDGGDGVVTIALTMSAAPGSTVPAVTFCVGGIERAATVRATGSGLAVNATVRVPDPQLWWPHTHGEQPLYDVTAQLVIGDSESRVHVGRVAFRSIALATDDGDFALSVNGRRVFARGACWSPPDPLRLHSSAAEYRRILGLARDAGMNMLRIGGTMVYEHDDFYSTCDEMGIMVWQDMMFANMDYPYGDEVFLADVMTEARQFLETSASHPCIALICGNSEIEQQAAMLGFPESQWRSTLFSEVLPAQVSRSAPGIPYWPSSPSGGVLPFHVNAGDGHYFGYGPYRRPFTDVRASNVRFASETLAFANVPEPAFVDRMTCGIAGAGHHPEWKRGVPRDNGASWDFEDVRDHYVREIFGADPLALRTGDPERYLALGRVAAGEVMQRTIGEWRRTGSMCSGALVWLYRDLRPGAGWGVLDYDGMPKAAYYYLARAFRPVTVIISDEGLNGLDIHVVNETSQQIAPLLMISLLNGSVQTGETARRLLVAAHSTTRLSADDLIGTFTDISYAYRFGPAGHDTVVATLLDPDSGALLAQAFHFPTGLAAPRATARLSARVERVNERSHAVFVSTDELALAVSIDAPGWLISDNYFNIAPNSERRIVVTATRDGTVLAGRISALNSDSRLSLRGS